MTFKVLGAGSQPKLQLHLGSCHHVPVYLGASFAVHAICTTHRDGLAPSQSQPQRTSVAGKRQPDLTSPEVVASRRAGEWAFSTFPWERS